jgi:hypothetical protein
MASAYAYALLLTAVASLLAYASARAPANEYVNEIVQTSKQLPELNDYFVDYAHLKGMFQKFFFDSCSTVVVHRASNAQVGGSIPLSGIPNPTH